MPGISPSPAISTLLPTVRQQYRKLEVERFPIRIQNHVHQYTYTAMALLLPNFGIRRRHLINFAGTELKTAGPTCHSE